jgi:hypothetical protein
VTPASLPVLSGATLAICRTYFRKDGRGRVAKDCCNGCPLMTPCFAACGPTADNLAAHVNSINAAADAVPSADGAA